MTFVKKIETDTNPAIKRKKNTENDWCERFFIYRGLSFWSRTLDFIVNFFHIHWRKLLIISLTLKVKYNISYITQNTKKHYYDDDNYRHLQTPHLVHNDDDVSLQTIVQIPSHFTFFVVFRYWNADDANSRRKRGAGLSRNIWIHENGSP